MKLIYLATPYSDPDHAVRESRFIEATRIAALLMSNGVYLFCPIAHTHPIAMAGNLPPGWDYWQAYDRAMLFACNELWVVKMPGWDKSTGIAGEIRIATELGLKTVFMEVPEVPDAKG